MKNIIFLLIVIVQQSLVAQVTFLIDSLPENHDFTKDIYVSGDFEGWTGGQDEYKLSLNNEIYSIVLPEQIGTLKFKFTMGSWEAVETSFDGNGVDNRTYAFSGKSELIKINIANWSDSKSAKSTASKNVSILSENFHMPQLDRNRRIWIYLPPDYKNSIKEYPVIYMHDGQNLFDVSTSFSGEWEIDETLDKMYAENGFGAIVIGIDNGRTKRLDEYAPWKNLEYGGGEGDAYVDFIVKTLKPFVDENYRTLLDKTDTAMIGSSMGGLISYYAALKYPEVFGKIGVYSPAFWFSPEIVEFTTLQSEINNTKIYFLAGGKEGLNNVDFSEISQTVKDLNSVMAILKEQGFPEDDMFLKVVPEGIHNEKLWRENFEETIRWLLDQ